MTLFSRIKRRLISSETPVLSSVDAYALWAKSYPAEAHNVLMQLEQESMLSLMPDVADKVVLDLACGTGRYGKIAENMEAGQVIGIDNSEAMLQKAVISAVSLATTGAIPLATASVDFILCGMALGHLPDIKSSISEISRVLKPGGVALISDFHPYQFLSGAQRTFQFNETTYAVEHHVHHISEYVAIASENGLSLTGLKEPVYQNNIPVVLVMHFTKNATL